MQCEQWNVYQKQCGFQWTEYWLSETASCLASDVHAQMIQHVRKSWILLNSVEFWGVIRKSTVSFDNPLKRWNSTHKLLTTRLLHFLVFTFSSQTDAIVIWRPPNLVSISILLKSWWHKEMHWCHCYKHRCAIEKLKILLYMCKKIGIWSVGRLKWNFGYLRVG